MRLLNPTCKYYKEHIGYIHHRVYSTMHKNIRRLVHVIHVLWLLCKNTCAQESVQEKCTIIISREWLCMAVLLCVLVHHTTCTIIVLFWTITTYNPPWENTRYANILIPDFHRLSPSRAQTPHARAVWVPGVCGCAHFRANFLRGISMKRNFCRN